MVAVELLEDRRATRPGVKRIESRRLDALGTAPVEVVAR